MRTIRKEGKWNHCCFTVIIHLLKWILGQYVKCLPTQHWSIHFTHYMGRFYPFHWLRSTVFPVAGGVCLEMICVAAWHCFFDTSLKGFCLADVLNFIHSWKWDWKLKMPLKLEYISMRFTVANVLFKDSRGNTRATVCKWAEHRKLSSLCFPSFCQWIRASDEISLPRSAHSGVMWVGPRRVNTLISIRGRQKEINKWAVKKNSQRSHI